jgi:hypothetical protein
LDFRQVRHEGGEHGFVLIPDLGEHVDLRVAREELRAAARIPPRRSVGERLRPNDAGHREGPFAIHEGCIG